MKKSLLVVIVLVISIVITACSREKLTINVKDETYKLEVYNISENDITESSKYLIDNCITEKECSGNGIEYTGEMSSVAEQIKLNYKDNKAVVEWVGTLPEFGIFIEFPNTINEVEDAENNNRPIWERNTGENYHYVKGSRTVYWEPNEDKRTITVNWYNK